ncbi:hypothetical protein MMC25_000289 [Agyrium rufum]|nr:hypothetical protein [Agyrium rufum]
MALEPDNQYTPLQLACACEQVTASLEVLTSTLPLEIHLCHCLVCRHASGQLCIMVSDVMNGVKSLKLKGEVSRGRTHNLERIFCGNCGTKLFDLPGEPLGEHLSICPGALVKGEGLTKLKNHIYVVDTKDGGVREWLLEADAWLEMPEISPRIPDGKPMIKSAEDYAKEESSKAERLNCRCFCGGVSFYITPPDEKSTQCSSPWPDLLKPYCMESSDNPEDVKWWLRANGTKYLAGTCACNSCRAASGFDIQTWAFVPKSNIFWADGKPLDIPMGTMKQYVSSEGAYREFCSGCGANLFWYCDARPDLIDVSVGLMHAASGVRAEEWLEWHTERVSFAECAQNKELITALEEGLKSWGKRKAEAGKEVGHSKDQEIK